MNREAQGLDRIGRGALDEKNERVSAEKPQGRVPPPAEEKENRKKAGDKIQAQGKEALVDHAPDIRAEIGQGREADPRD